MTRQVVTKYSNIAKVNKKFDLKGVFWYSASQKKYLESIGEYHKKFCVLDNGDIKEYTELVDYETLLQFPEEKCSEPDAVLLGPGTFLGWEDKL
jgi:hypothetical protein